MKPGYRLLCLVVNFWRVLNVFALRPVQVVRSVALGRSARHAVRGAPLHAAPRCDNPACADGCGPNCQKPCCKPRVPCCADPACNGCCQNPACSGECADNCPEPCCA